jgi:nucleoside-diphosphate kinase
VTPSRPAAVRPLGTHCHSIPLTTFIAILGATNPLASAPGTIRGDYAIDVGRNVCHGSDSVENAKKEIALWFKEGDVVSYKAAQFDWIYEKA